MHLKFSQGSFILIKMKEWCFF